LTVILIPIFIILFIQIQKILFSKFALKNLNIERRFNTDKTVCGNEVSYTIEITNNKLLPIPWITITEEIPRVFKYSVDSFIDVEEWKQIHTTTTSLMWFQKIKRHFKLKCTKRGYYEITNAKVKTGDIFGFDTIETEIKAPASILVLPRIHPINHFEITSKRPQGETIVKRFIIEDVMEFKGIRPYQPGDPLNRIHWPSTAKTLGLQVKQFDYTSDKKILIFLDVRTKEFIWEGVDTELLEESISFAASLTKLIIDRGIPVGVYSNGAVMGSKSYLKIPPSGNPKQVNLLLEGLAKLSDFTIVEMEELIMENLPLVSWDSHIVIITSLPSIPYIDKIRKLCKSEISIYSFNKDILKMENENIRVNYVKEGKRYE